MKMIRCKTNDVAIQYRMNAGNPGDVNRTHPATIEPTLIDPSAPPTAYGQPVLVDATTQGVRPLSTGDSAITKVYGVTVRPYPFQQSSGTNYGAAVLGSATPPATGVMDVLRSGYIIGSVPAGSTAVKGGAVFVWIAATSGSHIQGGFETAASGGNTIALDTNTYTFNGAPDAAGNVEICVNI